MLIWSENRDSYAVRHIPLEEVFVCAMLGVGIGWVYWGDHSHARFLARARQESFPSAVECLVLAAFVCGGLGAVVYLPKSSRVTVGRMGGGVALGGRGASLQVERFERACGAKSDGVLARWHVQAVLTQGGRVPVLDGWASSQESRAGRVAARLNELLSESRSRPRPLV